MPEFSKGDTKGDTKGDEVVRIEQALEGGLLPDDFDEMATYAQRLFGHYSGAVREGFKLSNDQLNRVSQLLSHLHDVWYRSYQEPPMSDGVGLILDHFRVSFGLSLRQGYRAVLETAIRRLYFQDRTSDDSELNAFGLLLACEMGRRYEVGSTYRERYGVDLTGLVSERWTPMPAEVEAVRVADSAVVGAEARSLALFGPKADAIRSIWALVNECGETGWDGEDAEPISEIAAHAAADFIQALPADVPLPEFAPEPDGSISLDWIKSHSKVLSISVGSGSRLPYAWLDGEDRGHEVFHFDGETIPEIILNDIRSINS